MVGSGWSVGGSNSSSGVVSSGISVRIQEQFESISVSSAQVLNENIFKVWKRDGVVTVGIIGNHEFKSFFSVSWVVNVQRTVKIRDHLSSFHGVHVSTSIGIIFTENFSSENSSTVAVQSSFISSSGGWGSSSDSAGWSISSSVGSSSLGGGDWSVSGSVSSGSLGSSNRGSGSVGSSGLGGGNWSLSSGVSSGSLSGSSGNRGSSGGCVGSDSAHFSFWILYLK